VTFAFGEIEHFGNVVETLELWFAEGQGFGLKALGWPMRLLSQFQTSAKQAIDLLLQRRAALTPTPRQLGCDVGVDGKSSAWHQRILYMIF
jgi:hypothetical protein